MCLRVPIAVLCWRVKKDYICDKKGQRRADLRFTHSDGVRGAFGGLIASRVRFVEGL